MKEKKIYLVFTDTNSMLTKAIKLYTRQPYNHASISFDNGLVETYSFGRKRMNNPFIGGFVKENIQSDFFNGAECSIYSCDVTEEQVYQMKKYIRNLERVKHLYRYNFIGLFALALNIEYKRSYALFCSEFVATVLCEADLMRTTKPLSMTTPEDLQNLPRFEWIYTGQLQEFQNYDFEIAELKELIL